MSTKQVTQLLTSASNASVDHKANDAIMHVTEDLEDASILAAVTMQPGRLPIETLVKLQNEDSYCEKIKKFMPKHFALKQGVLLRMRNEHSEKLLTPQIVLPEKLIEMVIKLEHNKGLALHIPYKRVAKTIATKYHFPCLTERVKEQIHRCLPC